VRVDGPRDAGEVGWGEEGWGEVEARGVGGEVYPDRQTVPVQGGGGGELPKGVREFLKTLLTFSGTHEPLRFGKEMVGRRVDVYWEGVHRF
jgi:hypothetical protein